MHNPTHFIELYKSKDRLITGSLHQIGALPGNLALTKSSKDLKTAFVWKIKEKPSAIIASHDGEVDATIIEKV